MRGVLGMTVPPESQVEGKDTILRRVELRLLGTKEQSDAGKTKPNNIHSKEYWRLDRWIKIQCIHR
jgi:hypothetical protein